MQNSVTNSQNHINIYTIDDESHEFITHQVVNNRLSQKRSYTSGILLRPQRASPVQPAHERLDGVHGARHVGQRVRLEARVRVVAQRARQLPRGRRHAQRQLLHALAGDFVVLESEFGRI